MYDSINMENFTDHTLNEEECHLKYQNLSYNTDSDLWCTPFYDDLFCWPPTPAGSIIRKTCAEIFRSVNITTFDGIDANKQPFAYRQCNINGTWLWGNWTNYTECFDLIPPPNVPYIPILVGYILFIFSTLSLVLLLVTLFIFFYFKSLMCSRLRVHRNLVVALIIHSILLIVISLPPIFSLSSYRDNEWLCKFVISLKIYAALSCINWMFIEGLLLHSRITTSIFRKDAPFKLYYCVGWGLPLLLITIWTTTMSYTLNTYCWSGYGESVYVWMITGPMITAIGINCIFLINIIRILITKLRLTLTVEMAQIRKAIKATALLFPLLGISHLLFCFNPGDNGQLESAYMITNAFLQSSQGIFVAILYCFLNTEVQTVIRNVYLRASMRRGAHNPNHKFSFRRNSSKRRMRFLSQTSASFVSNWEAGPHQCTDKSKVIADPDLELDELKPQQQQSSKQLKKQAKKSSKSSPQNRKCLIYRDGKIDRFKEPVLVVSQNGSPNHKK